MSIQPSITDHLWQSWMVPGAKVLIRGAIYTAPIAFIAYHSQSLTSRQFQVIVAISAPTVITYGAGTLETVTRAIVGFAAAKFGDAEHAETRRNNALMQLDTADRFVRNTLSPVSGWLAIASDGKAFYRDDSSQNSRIVFKDYLVYTTAHAVGIQPYRFLKATTTHIIVPVLEKSGRVFLKTSDFVIDTLETVGVWKGLSSIATWSVKLIETGVGYAIDTLSKNGAHKK